MLCVNHWGEVGIFRYSSRRDFMNMLAGDEYQAMMHFKLAAMGSIAIVPSQPHGLIFNPMPNIPVLLGFVFVIGYLLLLLIQLLIQLLKQSRRPVERRS